MKKELNPAVVGIIVVLVVAILGYVLYTKSGGDGVKNASDSPMPKAASDEMKKMMGVFTNKKQ